MRKLAKKADAADAAKTGVQGSGAGDQGSERTHTKADDGGNAADVAKSKTKSKGKADESKNAADAVAESDAENEAAESEGAEDVAGSDPDSQLAEERDKYLRLAAEYDNFRKRSAKEREKVYSDARIDTVTRLLPVYDNIERALKMECADEAFYKGVELTMTQLSEIFQDMNVLPISAVGEPFDPNRHNAVMSIEDPQLGEKVVAAEYQKGFMLGDRVIRFSTVVVAN